MNMANQHNKSLAVFHFVHQRVKQAAAYLQQNKTISPISDEPVDNKKLHSVKNRFVQNAAEIYMNPIRNAYQISSKIFEYRCKTFGIIPQKRETK